MSRNTKTVPTLGPPLRAAVLLAGAAQALELSERRLVEARALVEQGKPEATERAAERYRHTAGGR